MSKATGHPNEQKSERRTRLVAYVGTYGNGRPIEGGGITAFDVSWDGRRLTSISSTDVPKLAGYLVYAPSTATLYSVDERKNDGRGPVEPAASVHAFRVNQEDGRLSWLNSQPAPGPRPTFLAVDETKGLLVSANHGDFDHVEHVRKLTDGRWNIEYIYDDSTVIAYELTPDGLIRGICDVAVLMGRGKDPNNSPQAGGHGQASPHAHCAVIDPSGHYVLVCDKATDQIHVFFLSKVLGIASTFQLPEETGPRHIAFDPVSGRAFITCEFSSELASFDFNTASGELHLLHKQSTLDPAYKGPNEPAEVRVHPSGRFVYVNNRGEDSVAWFRIEEGGQFSRCGHVSISKSIHPGVAARSFAIDPSGTFMLVADRPANLMRSYAIDPEDGSLHALSESSIQDPAFIAFAELPGKGLESGS